MKTFLLDHQDFAPVALTYALLILGMAALIHATPGFMAALKGAL